MKRPSPRPAASRTHVASDRTLQTLASRVAELSSTIADVASELAHVRRQLELLDQRALSIPAPERGTTGTTSSTITSDQDGVRRHRTGSEQSLSAFPHESARSARPSEPSQGESWIPTTIAIGVLCALTTALVINSSHVLSGTSVMTALDTLVGVVRGDGRVGSWQRGGDGILPSAHTM